MRKTYQSLTILGLCLLVSSAAVAGIITKHGAAVPTQEAIFRIDSPTPGSTVFGIVPVQGYVMDPRGVSRITLLVDSTAIHDADINQPRADVRRKYPAFEGEPFPYEPGFVTSFLASNFNNGSHTLAIQVTYSDSSVATLGQMTVTVDNTQTQAPIGALDSPRDESIYGAQDVVSGVYPITGWAIDAQGIREHGTDPAGCDPTTDVTCHILADIEVMMDNTVIGQSIYPLPRPDVSNAYPDVPDAFKSGWQMNLDTTRYTNGAHTLSVRAWNVAGLNRILGTRDIWIDNNEATLQPFGHIDWPMNNAHFFSTSCSGPGPSGIQYAPGHRIEWVSGWVIAQNDQPQYEQVSNVELMLDGNILQSTRTDCNYLPQFGMNVNCYAAGTGTPYERPDILYQYPQFGNDAKYSGYFFAVDVDYLLFLGYDYGLHYFSIRVTTPDPIRPNVIIDEVPVIILCPQTGKDFPSFGELEHPVSMELMKGTYLVTGWVWDYQNVVSINVYVDGVLDGSASGSDVHLYRPDLLVRYPWYPIYILQYAGFQYSLDTSKYVDGIHQLVLETVDASGFHNYWVQRAVSFNNLNRP